MSNLSDNIADEPTIDVSPAMVIDDATDEYMKKFELVESQVQIGTKYIKALQSQTCRDHRIPILIQWAEQQQKTMENLYDLLVEMNNFFAQK